MHFLKLSKLQYCEYAHNSSECAHNSSEYAQVCFEYFKYISTNMNNLDITTVNFLSVKISHLYIN